MVDKQTYRLRQSSAQVVTHKIFLIAKKSINANSMGAGQNVLYFLKEWEMEIDWQYSHLNQLILLSLIDPRILFRQMLFIPRFL